MKKILFLLGAMFSFSTLAIDMYLRNELCAYEYPGSFEYDGIRMKEKSEDYYLQYHTEFTVREKIWYWENLRRKWDLASRKYPAYKEDCDALSKKCLERMSMVMQHALNNPS